MEEGWVYVLVNSSIPGMAKVGRTCRDPTDRAAELSAVTGVATPFVLAFEQHFLDCHSAERAIHAELDQRGLRVAVNREFFRGSPSDIIRVVLEAGEVCGPSPAACPQTAESLLAAGDRALHGLGDTLQDTGEAVRCYKLASARGSLLALERLGGVYRRLYAIRGDHASRRRALIPLKDGARRGNAYCYCEMAALFALEGHVANFAKAWSLFFAGRAAAAEAEGGEDLARFTAACCRYIELCIDLRLQPAHAVELRAVSEAILSSFTAELNRVRADPIRRLRVAGALRWTFSDLSPAAAGSPAVLSIRQRWRRWVSAPEIAAA